MDPAAPMDVLALLFERPILGLFLTVSIGLLIGRVRLAGVSLGSSGVIFAGLALGHFGAVPLEGIGDLGLVLFVYGIGITAGPSFFRSFARQGGDLTKLTVGLVAIAAATTWVLAKTLSIPDWEITNFRSESRAYQPIPGERQLPGFLISFDARRRSGHYLIKVIVPLVLIVAMSWVVFWIDPQQAASQISVAVTAMLTLIAYRFAVGSDLPNIPYLTRMDLFLLGSTVLVFAGLVEVVITSSLASRDRLERARRVDRWARVIFPSAFVLLSLRAFAL